MNINGFYANYVEAVNIFSPDTENYTSRKSFVCLHVVVYPNSDFCKKVKENADKILPKLNKGQANSSTERDFEIVEVNNLSGILAETVCEEIMRFRYGDAIKRIASETSVNQIDINISNNKTIEVRSSCIRNGILFSLFHRNKRDINLQDVDILGPYSNGYKPGEIQKDYYMRVIFPFDINDFSKMWKENTPITLYITGGATKHMMSDSNIYQIKHLVPQNSSVEIESDYRTIPLGRSLDIREFFTKFEYENPEIKIKRGLIDTESYICSSCFEPMSKDEYSFSIAKIHSPLCLKCQKKFK